MKLGESLLFTVVLLLVSVLFAQLTRTRYFSQALDEAYFLESIDTTYNTGKPQTMLTTSVVEALETVIVQPAAEVCEADLTHPRRESMSVFEKHAFPIFYLLALLRFFTSSLNVLVLCAVVAFPGLLGCVYAVARRFGCPVWLSGILTLLTAAHPAWSYAAMGQFYPDKLFPVFCIVYLVILHEHLALRRSRPWMLMASGILAASTSERSAIMLVAATGVALAWHSRRGFERTNLAPLALTAGLTLYVLGYMRFVQANYDYVSFGKSAADLFQAGVAGLRPETGKFLVISMALLLPFALAGGMWSIIAVGALLPNLIGSVGGAEKLGWSTHYHSAYFPFLLFAVILGAAALYRRSQSMAKAGGVLATVVSAMFLVLEPITPTPLFALAPENIRQSALGQIVEFHTGTGPASWHVERAKYLHSVANLIPAGSEVSTTEFNMPVLYEHGVHLLRFYPLGVGKSKYVVVPYVETEPGKVLYKGHVSYTWPDATEETNQCLTIRLNSTYRVVQMLQEFPGYGTAVLELK